MVMSQQDEVGPVVVNAGIGGNNTAEGLARFERDVVAHAPDVVVIYYGMNDSLNSKKRLTVEAFDANIRQMLALADDIGSQSILVTLHPVIAEFVAARHGTSSAEIEARNAAFDQAIRRVASETTCGFADFRQAVEAAGGASTAAESLLRNPANSGVEDGVHLRAEGYRLLAGTVAASLSKSSVVTGTVVCFGDSLTAGAAMEGEGTAEGRTYPAYLRECLRSR